MVELPDLAAWGIGIGVALGVVIESVARVYGQIWAAYYEGWRK